MVSIFRGGGVAAVVVGGGGRRRRAVATAVAVLPFFFFASRTDAAFCFQSKNNFNNKNHHPGSNNSDNDNADAAIPTSSGGGGGWQLSRRRVLNRFWASAVGSSCSAAAGLFWLDHSSSSSSSSVALAKDKARIKEEDGLIDVYFGCGCFWHVEHEFAMAERRILNRSNDMDLTARAGYAGGELVGSGTTGGEEQQQGSSSSDGNNSKNNSNKVCYHNRNRVADYGSLGHAEVVHLRIPRWSFPEFVQVYTKLFDENGYRPDQFGDRGSEYRNLVGFPGGAIKDGGEVYLKQLVEGSKAAGDKLAFARGSGNDPDKRALVFVMDTADFPFHVAEQYHQFHDGFARGENYPNSYNDLAQTLAKQGILGTSDCPNGML